MRAVMQNSGVAGFDGRGGSAMGQAKSFAKNSSPVHYTTPRPGVKPERTGWRDEALSARHRLYGCDAPMVDVDFLCCEYDSGIPCAIIEYKASRPFCIDRMHASYRVLRRLSDSVRVPFAVVFYNPTVWRFTVYPMNDYAEAWFEEGEELSEREYVTRLYQIRGRELPHYVADALEVTP